MNTVDTRQWPQRQNISFTSARASPVRCHVLVGKWLAGPLPASMFALDDTANARQRVVRVVVLVDGPHAPMSCAHQCPVLSISMPSRRIDSTIST
jgi:hypothetical protein